MRLCPCRKILTKEDTLIAIHTTNGTYCERALTTRDCAENHLYGQTHKVKAIEVRPTDFTFSTMGVPGAIQKIKVNKKTVRITPVDTWPITLGFNDTITIFRKA